MLCSMHWTRWDRIGWVGEWWAVRIKHQGGELKPEDG